jgi:hypothetical protein
LFSGCIGHRGDADLRPANGTLPRQRSTSFPSSSAARAANSDRPTAKPAKKAPSASGKLFNLLNRVNFFNPGLGSGDTSGNGIVQKGPTIANAGFGSIRWAYDPRIGQLALKLVS